MKPLSGLAAPVVRERLLVVVAHPDDESIGAGALLRRAPDAWVLHLTDGAPLDRARPDATDPERLAYAALRREELDRALTLAGVPAARRLACGATDQAAADELPRLVAAVASAIRDIAPDLVLTHPYEGGHPDHDAAAFVVGAALASAPGPAHVEMAFYHGLGGELVTQRFLPGPAAVDLPVAPALKAELLACHRSQRAALAPFSPAVERVRLAPRYDFLAPPHAGPLWYERQGWGTGAAFRGRVRDAVVGLGLGDDLGGSGGRVEHGSRSCR